MGGKKAGGGFLGVGGKSGFLNTGLFSSGPQKIKGFEMSPQSAQYEQEMMARQNAIASGQAPSYSQMMFNKAQDQNTRNALAMAASQRGMSNPALAFRQAQMASQQANLQGAQDAAIMAEQERRQADQMVASQVNAQRGVAFNQANTNLNSTMQNQQNQLNAISSVGQGAAKAMMSSGGVVPGVANVPGDSPANDTVPALLSPDEIVVPRSATKSEKALKMFIEKIKIEEKLKKMGEK